MANGAGSVRSIARGERSRRRRDQAAAKAGYRDWDDFVGRVKREASCAEVAARWGGIELRPAGTGSMILCPFHVERTPSCHLDGPLFHCFGASCGASGDVVTFTRKIAGTGFVDTVLTLASEFGLPVPDMELAMTGCKPGPGGAGRRKAGAGRGRSAPTANGAGALHGPASWPAGLPPEEPDLSDGSLVLWFRNSGYVRHHPGQWHHYRDMEGRLVALTARTERSGGKMVLPVTWRINPATGWGHWACSGFAGGRRPVYGREKLAGFGDRDAAILLVDGEKTADAANRMLGPLGWAALSAMGGCKSGHLADWGDVAELIGRPGRQTALVVWPDADRPQESEPDPVGATGDRLLAAVAGACGSEERLLAAADCRVVRLTQDRRHGWALDDAELQGLTGDWAAGRIGRAIAWSGVTGR